MTIRVLTSSFKGFDFGVSISQLLRQNSNLLRISMAVEENQRCDIQIDCFRTRCLLK